MKARPQAVDSVAGRAQARINAARCGARSGSGRLHHPAQTWARRRRASNAASATTLRSRGPSRRSAFEMAATWSQSAGPSKPQQAHEEQPRQAVDLHRADLEIRVIHHPIMRANTKQVLRRDASATTRSPRRRQRGPPRIQRNAAGQQPGAPARARAPASQHVPPNRSGPHRYRGLRNDRAPVQPIGDEMDGGPVAAAHPRPAHADAYPAPGKAGQQRGVDVQQAAANSSAPRSRPVSTRSEAGQHDQRRLMCVDCPPNSAASKDSRVSNCACGTTERRHARSAARDLQPRASCRFAHDGCRLGSPSACQPCPGPARRIRLQMLPRPEIRQTIDLPLGRSSQAYICGGPSRAEFARGPLYADGAAAHNRKLKKIKSFRNDRPIICGDVDLNPACRLDADDARFSWGCPRVAGRRACALTVGNFDGVHRGHRALLASRGRGGPPSATWLPRR